MSTQTTTYPASTLAKLFHLTERRVQQLAKEGIITKDTRGKYDLVSSVQGYVKYLQDRVLGRADGAYNDPFDIKIERKRLIKAQADIAEQENQQRRGDLIALSWVSDLLHEITILYSSGIDALPGRLAHELAGLHDPAETKRRLFEECREIRCATAERLRRCAESLKRGAGFGKGPRCTLGENA
jgi:phage terminase Nu1 subunit (DNA packaging protein)